VTLLDIMMPVMSGFEACQAMRALPLQGPRRPKIIAVTALSDELSRTKGLEECGMDEWLTKPLAMNRLLEDLKRWRADFDAEGQTSES
jgi:CheY-like chemotaxis protein